MNKACGQDKIASASIQTYDVMVACSNSEELCPNLFRRRKGITTRTKRRKIQVDSSKARKKNGNSKNLYWCKKKKLFV